MFHIKLIKSKVEKTNSKEDQRGKIKTKMATFWRILDILQHF